MARFQPGQSGNPAGRRPRKLFDDHLRAALSTKRSEKAKVLVEKLIDKAATGNVAALKLVCERIGGKPKPADQIGAPNPENLSLDEVRRRLAELLARPEVRKSLQSMLATSAEAETIQ